jgi:uncharacterized protein YdhG (YjbR/CyaY superfamily)
MAAGFQTIDEYIAAQPPDVQPLLRQVRRTIHEAVPGLGEKMAYGMPMLTSAGGNLVSFGAWKKHLGVYPVPAGDGDFQAAIAPYRGARSTARFSLASPVPYDLIARIATLLAQERG